MAIDAGRADIFSLTEQFFAALGPDHIAEHFAEEAYIRVLLDRLGRGAVHDAQDCAAQHDSSSGIAMPKLSRSGWSIP